VVIAARRLGGEPTISRSRSHGKTKRAAELARGGRSQGDGFPVEGVLTMSPDDDILGKDERILHMAQNLSWLPQPNEACTVLSASLPPPELTATALVLAFDRGQLLHTRLAARGWDIVGGHIEPGESPEAAARREAYEEAGARLRELHVLGYQRLRLLGPRPAWYRYVYPDSYQVFYWAQIEALDEFLPTEEALERALFAPDAAHELPFVRTLGDLYLVALQAAMNEP
jgi:8-oxo-dGTP diphosphatase